MSEGTMKIADNVVAALAYTLTNDEGEVMDEASGDDLLWYLHGHENLLPAVEANLLGLGVGDHVKFTLEAHEGYGERDEANVLPIDRDMLPPEMPVELGEELLIDLGDGPQICTIVEVTETQAMVDLNHPMAGFRLHFDITVQTVREAFAEEIEHGHVHGADGTEMHEDDEEYEDEDEGDDEGDDEKK
jgi:FKBP-type peptidyl-prolyl cis-trans isomerase SlyD